MKNHKFYLTYIRTSTFGSIKFYHFQCLRCFANYEIGYVDFWKGRWTGAPAIPSSGRCSEEA